jgi:hypothetical protein
MDVKRSRLIRKKGEIHRKVMFNNASQNTSAPVFMQPKAKKKVLHGCWSLDRHLSGYGTGFPLPHSLFTGYTIN